jgi:hypothetical protein
LLKDLKRIPNPSDSQKPPSLHRGNIRLATDLYESTDQEAQTPKSYEEIDFSNKLFDDENPAVYDNLGTGSDLSLKS